MKKENDDLSKEFVKVKNKFSTDLRKSRKKGNREKWKTSRKEHLESLGWSLEYYANHKLTESKNVGDQARKINRGKETQEEEAKLRESKFAKEYKVIARQINGKPRYLTKQNNKKSELETRARFRLGTETRANKYWTSEDERKCRLCGKEEETMEHVMEKCEKTSRTGRWMEQLQGETAFERMKEISKIRESEEK